jgi:hypothetical protein
MTPILNAEPEEFARVRFILTDMDETLTYRGRLHVRLTPPWNASRARD